MVLIWLVLFWNFISDCGLPYKHHSTLVSAPNTLVGSSAIYACATGYTNLVGDSSRVCQTGGSWSGSAPTCSKIGKDTTLLNPDKKYISVQAQCILFN